MATRVLLHFADAANKCVSSSLLLHRSKFQVQSVFKQHRYFRRFRNTRETVKSPFVNEVRNVGSPNNKHLLKSILFATTFTGVTFTGAIILEYERIRANSFKAVTRLPFRGLKTVTGWRSDVKHWWKSLTEGQRVFSFICYANVLVFLAWKVPKLKPTMLKYFATNPASSVTCAPMLLSAFSHYSLWHLAANMYVLHSFSTTAVAYLGREHFLALYLSSGVISSMTSIAFKVLVNRTGYSLGASGAVMGVLSYVCAQFPDTKLSIILLPQFTFSAGAAIQSLIAFDAVGCIMRWQFIDHAAHLGGALFGIFWQMWGVENIWRKRKVIMEPWHNFRSPPKSH